MNRIISVCVLLVLSMMSYADEFKGHCRDREPDMIAEGNKCTGPVAEIIETALSRLGHTIIWIETPWKRSIEAARTGQVDILPRHSMTPEREEFLNAIAYGYKIRHIYFMVSPLKYIDIDNFADLSGLKVGMLRGSFYSDQLAGEPNFIKIELDSNDQIVKMLEYGRIDVGITSSAHEEDKFRAIKNVKQANYKDAFLNSRNISIPKASPMKKHFYNFSREISNMAESGEITKIFDKYSIAAPAQKDWNLP